MKKFFTSVILSLATLCGVAAVPAPPTNLSAHSTYMESNLGVIAEYLELKWTLPTLFEDGTAFDSDVCVESVKVMRNNEEIALLEGAVTEFTEAVECQEYPEGAPLGRNAYQVLVQVNGVWSEPTLPYLTEIGERRCFLEIPWTPKMNNFTPEDPGRRWYWSYYFECKELSKGLTIDSNGWIASSFPLYLKPMQSYILEYEVSSKVNAEYTVGVVDFPYPYEFELYVVQPLVGNTIAGSKAERKRVEFTYEPKHTDGSPYWNVYPYIAIMLDNAATLEYLSITEYDSASLSLPEADAAADCAVYNLQGVCLGRSADGSLEGYAPGIYILRGADGQARKVLVK